MNVQDPAQPDASVVDSLFGVKLHTSLKCEESGETIEVRFPETCRSLLQYMNRCRNPKRHCCYQGSTADPCKECCSSVTSMSMMFESTPLRRAHT